MPYFVYKMFPGKRLELVQPHAAFKDAKAQASALRAALAAQDNYTVRVIFAKDTTEAEHLVATERPFEVRGEE